jgi:hypothetical protein
MSFDTYADLKDRIADQLARSDLTTQIPDFITLFEAAAARKLRVRPMETTTQLTPTSGVASLPTDYLGWRSVVWTGDPNVVLEYVHPSYLEALWPTAPAGTPHQFTIYGSQLSVLPSDDTPIQLDYFAKNSALSSSLNNLYTNHPDAYFFGSLVEAYTFVKDYEQAQIWKARRDEVFDEISKLNFRENGALQIRVMGATP